MSEADLSEALKTAQAEMYAGRFDAALVQLDALLAADPQHVDALYMKAVCLRYGKDHAGARKALDTLKAQAPDFGRALQEEGHLCRETGDDAAAIAA